MKDPLQIYLGNRGREEVIDARSGRAVPLRAYGRSAEGTENEPDDLATLVQYLRILWKNKWILLLAMTVGAVAGTGYVLRMLPLYSAKTTVEIQKPPQAFGKAGVEQNSTQTEIELLKSKGSRTRALQKLLAKKIEIKDSKIEGPLASLRTLLKLEDPAKTTAWGDAASYASSFLTVLPVKDSEIIEITTLSPVPQASKEYADTVAEEFMESIKEKQSDSFRKTGLIMNDETQVLQNKIEREQQQLAEFARANGLTFSSNGQSLIQSPAEEKLRRIQSDLLAAQNELINKDSITAATQSSPTESLPAVLDSGPMANMQADIARLEKEKAALLVNLFPIDKRVQVIQAQIDELKEHVNTERKNIQSRTKIENDTAEKRVQRLTAAFEAASKSLADQSGASIQAGILQSQIDSDRKLFDAMMQQGKEAGIASALNISGARIVDHAGITTSPVTPDLLSYLTLGMVGGLCFGAGLVILRSRADLTIQAPRVMELELNIRELGVIPSAKTDRTARKLRKYSPALLPASASGSPRRLDTVDCLEMVTRSEKPSIMAEAFRSTMTSILYSDDNEERPKVLVFTSASSGEGKSTVISNLAIALAQIHQRVLLIDADMRLPRVHEIFDVPNSFGLSDVLHEQKPVEEYVEESLVRKTHIPYLYVLPAGPARAHLSRLFHSLRMQDLLLRFRDTFDVVLIDSAPVLIVPDSRILARSADAVVLVIRAHQTHQEAAFAAASRFASDGTRILGTILNDWNPDKSTQAYGYNGGTGYYSGTRD